MSIIIFLSFLWKKDTVCPGCKNYPIRHSKLCYNGAGSVHEADKLRDKREKRNIKYIIISCLLQICFSFNYHRYKYSEQQSNATFFINRYKYIYITIYYYSFFEEGTRTKREKIINILNNSRLKTEKQYLGKIKINSANRSSNLIAT